MVNSRGDVVALFDSTGKELARYNYDAWGNCTVTTPTGTALTDANHIANVNPLRYRGYYLDTDTGLYYLQSRYYDSVTHRMLNADSADVLGVQDNLSDKNLFVYCDNNPVSRADDEGELWHAVAALAGGVLGMACSLVNQMLVEKKSWNEVDFVSVGLAGCSGALAASGLGRAGQIIMNAAISGLDRWRTGGDALDIVAAAGAGVVSGFIGGRGANYKGAIGNTFKKGTQILERESRRANQRYAAKAVARGSQYVRQTVTRITAKAAGRTVGAYAGGTAFYNYYRYLRQKASIAESKKSMGYFYSTGRR